MTFFETIIYNPHQTATFMLISFLINDEENDSRVCEREIVDSYMASCNNPCDLLQLIWL